MGNVRSGRDIDAALRKKGFTRKNDGKHLRYSFILPEGSKSGITTLISHGAFSETIGAPLISQMARQLRLTKKQFLQLIDCTLDEEGYRIVVSASVVSG